MGTAGQFVCLGDQMSHVVDNTVLSLEMLLQTINCQDWQFKMFVTSLAAWPACGLPITLVVSTF